MRRLRSARCFTGERGWPSTRLGPQALWPCRLSRLPSGWGVATPPFLPLLPLPFFPGRGGGATPLGRETPLWVPLFCAHSKSAFGDFHVAFDGGRAETSPVPFTCVPLLPRTLGEPKPRGEGAPLSAPCPPLVCFVCVLSGPLLSFLSLPLLSPDVESVTNVDAVGVSPSPTQRYPLLPVKST